MLEQLIALDTELFLFLNGIHNSFFDTVMYWITARASSYPLYITILFFVFKRYKWRGLIVFLFMVLLVLCADLGSVHLFKNTFERLRPSHNQEIAHLVHIVKGYRGGQFGFISSHASNTFAYAAFTSALFSRKWFSICIFVWAIVVSYSRIYLGVHFPADILGGAVFGMTIGFSLFKIYELLINKLNARRASNSVK